MVQSLGRVSGPARDIAVREWLRSEKEMAEAPLADKQVETAGRERGRHFHPDRDGLGYGSLQPPLRCRYLGTPLSHRM
jgi:hypothetical protein